MKPRIILELEKKMLWDQYSSVSRALTLKDRGIITEAEYTEIWDWLWDGYPVLGHYANDKPYKDSSKD